MPAGGGQELTVRGEDCQWGKSYGCSDIAGHSSNFFLSKLQHTRSYLSPTHTTQTQYVHVGHACGPCNFKSHSYLCINCKTLCMYLCVKGGRKSSSSFSSNPIFLFLYKQETVSGGVTYTVLKNLNADTLYTVTVTPVYPEMEGLPQSESEKTSEFVSQFTQFRIGLSIQTTLAHVITIAVFEVD